jgi:hypothetical protein
MEVVVRILDLIRLAVDPGAAPEEARSAAHAACKLIWDHKLTLTYGKRPEPLPPKPAPPSRATPGVKVVFKKDRCSAVKNVWPLPASSGRCEVCSRLFRDGDRVVRVSHSKGLNAVLYIHVQCNRPAF